MSRTFASGTISKDADGVRLLVSSAVAGQRWTRMSLRAGKENYTCDMSPHYPSRLMTEFAIPFGNFISADKKPLTADQAASIDGIGLDFDTNYATTLYLDRITTFHHKRYSAWLSVASSKPLNCMFEPGETVRFTLTPGGTPPAAAKAFRYDVTDFYGKIAASGTVKLDGSAAYPLDLTPKTHGYYELRAWWLDDAGKALEPHSCIRAEGTQAPGVTTFSVMPHTAAQNIERFKAWGDKAFFGLHGDFLGISDLIGLTWRFSYRNWGDVELVEYSEITKGSFPSNTSKHASTTCGS